MGPDAAGPLLSQCRKLDKREWRPFLDGLSRLLEAKVAEIEVASLSFGDQIEAEGCHCRDLPTTQG
jgi:Family of unknown function (DUF5335)